MVFIFTTAGECSSLEKQVAELQTSESGLQKHKVELEDKLQQLEELLASTTSTRDELQGAHLLYQDLYGCLQQTCCRRHLPA